jgi:dethiobiotin synthetase
MAERARPTRGASLVLVTGTGTEIGKTFVAAGLVTAWARQPSMAERTVAGIKPIETGGNADVDLLGRASTFHVTRFTPPYLFADAVSPHLASRREGRPVDLEAVAHWVDAIRAEADAVVLELPGGLFSPLTDNETNVDLVRRVAPSAIVLVAPDRLGVLHDVIATVTAATAAAVEIDGVVLSAPAISDLSTGTNAAELERVVRRTKVLAALPRCTQDRAAEHLDAALASLLARIAAGRADR